MERGRKSRVTARQPERPMRVQDSNRMSTVYTTPRSASGASMPRSSSIYGFGGAEKIKDPRPLNDKVYVQQCIRQLHEFLTERGYNVAPKSLQSPSTKEFVKIFEFIYCQMNPTFEMPSSKAEEEVPALLKSLRLLSILFHFAYLLICLKSSSL
ncbi:kinetochore protein NDC80 homolog [Festucalex cinctus]